jgi:hypothetical protein
VEQPYRVVEVHPIELDIDGLDAHSFLDVGEAAALHDRDDGHVLGTDEEPSEQLDELVGFVVDSTTQELLTVVQHDDGRDAVRGRQPFCMGVAAEAFNKKFACCGTARLDDVEVDVDPSINSVRASAVCAQDVESLSNQCALAESWLSFEMQPPFTTFDRLKHQREGTTRRLPDEDIGALGFSWPRPDLKPLALTPGGLTPL